MIWRDVFYCVSFGFGVAMFALGNMILASLGAVRFLIDRRRLLISAAVIPVGYFALTAYSDAFFFAVFAVILWLAVATGKQPGKWLVSPLSRKRRSLATFCLTGLLFFAP